MKVTLAKTYYRPDGRIRVSNINGWFASEKLDGWRAYFRGGRMYSRSGRPLDAPSFWKKNIPSGMVLDGELFLGRGTFQQLSSMLRSKQTTDDEWRQIEFHVFDVDEKTARPFAQRYQRLATLVSSCQTKGFCPLRLVDQRRFGSESELLRWASVIIAEGGEGLMIRDPVAPYIHGRTDRLLKIKEVDDAEAKIVGLDLRDNGQLRALIVDDGIARFRLGTGFNDDERQQIPFVLGDFVTFTFNGRTKGGVPRHARFLRIYHTK